MRLALHEFGDPRGAPLFFFHGWPGSGAQAALLDEAAKKVGFRVVAPDRPGIGQSPIQPGRCLLDWPRLIEDLAGSLGWRRFAVLGVSGGGPYALACAHAIPGMLTATAIVCGAPPLSDPDDLPLLHPGYRLLLALFRRSPALVHAILSAAKPIMDWRDAGRFYPPLRILLPRSDADAIASPENFAAIFECQRDAFSDVDGVFADATIYARDWGFDPRSIGVPLEIWHGLDDANFHPDLARRLASQIPGARLHLVEGEGHFSLPINHAETILAALRKPC